MLGVLGKSAKEVLIRTAFVVWITSVTIMAIIPLSDSGLMASSDISSSGAEKHFVGYFVGALLLYYGYGKKGAGRRAQGARGEDQEIRNKNDFAQSHPSTISRSYPRGIDSVFHRASGAGKGAEFRSDVDEKAGKEGIKRGIWGWVDELDGCMNGWGRGVWMCGLLVFGYSVVLEGVQAFLPHRTFNPYDIVGNGMGVSLFVIIWVMRYGRAYALK